MSSYDFGKREVCEFIRKRFGTDTEILDVGACDGKWRDLLPEYKGMDACEAFLPNAREIERKYRNVFAEPIQGLKYGRYGLVIFGDVIEHMTVADAAQTLQYAEKHADAVIVSVPFRYPQGELYGNPYERHIQDDLTPELFRERYGEFTPIWQDAKYCYYFRSEK